MHTTNELTATVLTVPEIELRYTPVIPPAKLPRAQNPNDAHALFLTVWDKETIEYTEEFKIMLLNKDLRVLGICTITRGGMTGVLVDPKLIFVAALKAGASRIITAHNYPSGTLTPSMSDLLLAQKIKELGEFLTIDVADYLIVTRDNFYSFADAGDL